ncbi:hypothetical protein HPB47_021438, partial [Ixodes persulcatus]
QCQGDHFELVAVFGDNALVYDTEVKRRRRFQCGQTRLDDEEQSDRPSLIDEPKLAAQVEAVVVADRRITIEEIAQQLS